MRAEEAERPKLAQSTPQLPLTFPHSRPLIDWPPFDPLGIHFTTFPPQTLVWLLLLLKRRIILQQPIQRVQLPLTLQLGLGVATGRVGIVHVLKMSCLVRIRMIGH